MYLRENVINNVKREQKMTDLLAFSEFWRRLSHLGKFNTCQWHSACTKFGHSNIFATLSYICARSAYKDALLRENRQSTTFTNFIFYTRPCVQIYGFAFGEAAHARQCSSELALRSLTRSLGQCSSNYPPYHPQR